VNEKKRVKLSGIRVLAIGVLVSLPLFSYAQRLEKLINSVLALHPSAEGQRALVQSAAAGVDSARWQFYPTPSVSIETAQSRATDRLYQAACPASWFATYRTHPSAWG